MNDLETLGWGSFFGDQLGEEDLALRPARVVAEHGASLELLTADGSVVVAVTAAVCALPAPAVGDWLLLAAGDGRRPPHPVRLLARRSALARRAAGERSRRQILAANVDVVFLVTAVGEDFNPRRLERMAVAVWQAGARPVVLVNKSDLADSARSLLAEVARSCPGVDASAVSALDGSGPAAVRRHLDVGSTGVLLGSSGVGKSTLVNGLLAHAVQETAPVSQRDGRGRHITASRRLFLLPGGGALIDGPGVREMRLWDGGEGLGAAFPDLARLAMACRFRDCRHLDEPGCAVREAVDGGELDPGRLASFHKLHREAEYERRKQDAFARAEETRRWKAIHRAQRRHHPRKG
jgi:ribosome biogenesis GTPase / thiamine phosphate phosphatase